MDGRLLRSLKTKEKLLIAAKEIFIEKGFQETTITQIIKKAGIGYGTAYTHFNGKDDILIVMMEDVMDRFYEIAEMHFQPGSLDDAVERITKQVNTFLNLANTEYKILSVFHEARGFSKEVEESWLNIRERFVKRIEKDIHYVQKNGLAKQNIDKRIMAKGWFFVNEMFLWEIVQGKEPAFTVEEIAKTLVKFYTTGMYKQN